jgi:hypothetical protein
MSGDRPLRRAFPNLPRPSKKPPVARVVLFLLLEVLLCLYATNKLGRGPFLSICPALARIVRGRSLLLLL